jgi:dihydrofolate synthase / folylpolyglutamate synthase
MSYPDSVRYLYALGNELKVGAKFGLERMETLLAALGNPQRHQRFVHVAGTNGKGSTCAMIASILRAAGFRTGLYTSPHLMEPTERIQIDGVPLTTQQFASAFQVVHEAAERLIAEDKIDAHPSYFEIVTAMALVFFREQCDMCVFEVGLGGRLDATNVIAPELCVITPVSFDHEAYLGNKLESIAFEKAGIIKSQVSLVLARQAAVADAVITKRAEEQRAPIIRTSTIELSNLSSHSGGSSFQIDDERYECPLPGRHQIENAVTAILAGRQLGIDTAALQSGIKNTVWPGRLERVSHNPDFILDGAHNPAGATALAAYIREFYSARPVWILYGAMRDKAIDEVTAQLFPLAERLIVTAPNFPRALRPETILEIAPHPSAHVTSSVAEAIELARSAPADAAIFITGSLFLVGEARKLLLEHPVS